MNARHLAALAVAAALGCGAAFAQTAPAPASTAMQGMHHDAMMMKGGAMQGGAMKGGAMGMPHDTMMKKGDAMEAAPHAKTFKHTKKHAGAMKKEAGDAAKPDAGQ